MQLALLTRRNLLYQLQAPRDKIGEDCAGRKIHAGQSIRVSEAGKSWNEIPVNSSAIMTLSSMLFNTSSLGSPVGVPTAMYVPPLDDKREGTR